MPPHPIYLFSLFRIYSSSFIYFFVSFCSCLQFLSPVDYGYIFGVVSTEIDKIITGVSDAPANSKPRPCLVQRPIHCQEEFPLELAA